MSRIGSLDKTIRLEDIIEKEAIMKKIPEIIIGTIDLDLDIVQTSEILMNLSGWICDKKNLNNIIVKSKNNHYKLYINAHKDRKSVG